MNAVQTAHTNNVELIKYANAQASFICEAMLGFQADDGAVYNKLVFVLVKRDAENKAVQTLRYWIDIPVAKVLMYDLWDGLLRQEHNEYKRRVNMERALKIAPQEAAAGAYRISLMNTEDGEKQWLYFDLNRLQARALARTVLDHLHCHELAQAIQGAIQTGASKSEAY